MFCMPKKGASLLSARALAVAVAAVLTASAASAESNAKLKKKIAASHDSHAKTKDAAAAAKPTLVGTFGDWGAYEAQGAKSKICYALAQPKQRSPASLKRDAAYIFISSRPGEGVHNEISVIMGTAVKEGGSDAKAEIGTSSFDLVTKGQNAWMKNAAQESQLIDIMKKHGRLIVKAPLAKSGQASDSYSLAGLAQALDRVAKDCP